MMFRVWNMFCLGALTCAAVAQASAAAAQAGAAQAGANASTTMLTVPVPLLGSVMGKATRSGEAVSTTDAAQADPAQAAALTEDGFERSARAQYGAVKVQALQFHDASGARAAFSLYVNGAVAGPKLGSAVPAGDNVIAGNRNVVLAQTVVLLADRGAPAAVLIEIVSALPKIGGPRSQRPLLPTLLPQRGLSPEPARYALGPAGYAAEGGALPAASLGWEKSGEAVTADYTDRRGKEALTLLLYPTPQIAGEHLRALQTELPSGTKLRREGELVAIASGSFDAAAAQNLLENAHLRNQVSFDKPMPPEFHVEMQKTYSLFRSVLVLSGVGALGAVILALFLGGGRALLRVMRGKDAAADVEFLSLHLDPRNPPAQSERTKLENTPR